MEINSMGNGIPLAQTLGIEPGGRSSAGTNSVLDGAFGRMRDSLSVSPLGQLTSGASDLSAQQIEEAKAFRVEMRESLRSGTFDPAEMAERAPDFLKQRAEDKGVSLEEAFGQLGDGVEQIRSKLTAAMGSGALAGQGLENLGLGSDEQYAVETLLAAVVGSDRE